MSRATRTLAASCVLAAWLAPAACSTSPVYLVPGAGPDDDDGFDATPGPDGASIPELPRDDGGRCEPSAVPQTLGIYVMVDRSASMAEPVGTGRETRWSVVVDALERFVSAPESAGLRVGLQYFARQTFSVLDPFASNCDPLAYAQADVEMAALPDNAAALVSSLNRLSLFTPIAGVPSEEYLLETPTNHAISGAVMKIVDFKRQNPGAEGVVLLVTDGAPLSVRCGSDMPATIAAAEAGVSVGVVTFVLGVGPNLTALEALATAGGTERAYLAPSDAAADVALALDSFREDAVPCSVR